MILVEGSVSHCLLLPILLLHLGVLFFFLLKTALFLTVSSLVGLNVSYNVDVGPIDILKGASCRVDPDSHGLVDPCNLDPVSRLHIINEVFICTKMDRLGCFSFWNAFWGFLNLHVLLVGEHTLVEDHLECISLVTILAEGWFLNTAVLGNPFLFSMALYTFKLCFFHLRHDVAVADDNTPESHQLVDMVRAELSNPVNLPEVMWSDLDDLVEFSVFIHKLVIHLLITLTQSVDIEAEIPVGLRDNEIEDWNNICRVVNNLAVQAWVICEDVVTVYLKYILVNLPDLVQF